MKNINSTGKTTFSSLLAVIISIVAALFILMVFILPAEFGKDITGLGAKFGVNNMSTDDVAEDAVIATDNSNNTAPNKLANVVDLSNDPDKIESPEHVLFDIPVQFMQTEVILEPFAQGEFKFDLETGNQINYTWSVDGGGLVYTDLHGHTPGASGDPEDEILVNYLDSQQDNSLSGQFVTPFGGDHGWFFLNLEDREVVIKIQASGHWDGYEFIPIESYF